MANFNTSGLSLYDPNAVMAGTNTGGNAGGMVAGGGANLFGMGGGGGLLNTSTSGLNTYNPDTGSWSSPTSTNVNAGATGTQAQQAANPSWSGFASSSPLNQNQLGSLSQNWNNPNAWMGEGVGSNIYDLNSLNSQQAGGSTFNQGSFNNYWNNLTNGGSGYNGAAATPNASGLPVIDGMTPDNPAYWQTQQAQQMVGQGIASPSQASPQVQSALQTGQAFSAMPGQNFQNSTGGTFNPGTGQWSANSPQFTPQGGGGQTNPQAGGASSPSSIMASPQGGGPLGNYGPQSGNQMNSLQSGGQPQGMGGPNGQGGPNPNGNWQMNWGGGPNGMFGSPQMSQQFGNMFGGLGGYGGNFMQAQPPQMGGYPGNMFGQNPGISFGQMQGGGGYQNQNMARMGGYNQWGNPYGGNPYAYMTGQQNNPWAQLFGGGYGNMNPLGSQFGSGGGLGSFMNGLGGMQSPWGGGSYGMGGNFMGNYMMPFGAIA